MLGLVGLLTATICTSCGQQQPPVGPRLGVPQPTVDQQISDGCARFQVRFDAGGSPIIEPIYNTGYCQTNQLRLLSDTAGSFDAATGTLRLAVVMENEGTAAVIPRVKIRFNADSVIRLDGQGNPVPGTPDILGYQSDSASTNGRNAYWFFDQSLAASGQPQVLMPGARTQRRWLEFRGNGWTDRVRLKLFATGAEALSVPASAPDSIPTSLINSLALLTDAAGKQQRSELVVLRFHQGTSQSSRQTAISGVGGVVVGGKAGIQMEGWYLVRVSSATTVSAIDSVIAILEMEPSVAVVGPFSVGFPNDQSWLRPNDGANWNNADWQTDRTFAVGANSALERISLPLAWGCSTGSTTTRLTLVDFGVHAPADLLPNISQPIIDPAPFRDHGTRIASVVGAVGNNGAGIAGVMWQSTLYLRSNYADPANPTQVSALPWWTATEDNLIAAGRNGSSVILFPHNYVWGLGVVPDTSILANRRQISLRDNALRNAILVLRQEGRFPLFVLSAGNDGIDARYGGFVNVRNVYPNQVLVVGGLTHSMSSPGQANQVDSRSNGGPAIDVLAPGDNIAVLDSTGAVTLDSGTSFAVPLVAGVAGLVKSFLPSVPDSLLKSIILGGTLDSVMTNAGLRPVLNAYAALRKAAAQPGAPLCGNRAWAANGTLRVERSVTNGVGIDESLATVPGDSRSHVNVFHGGKRIQNLNGTGWNSFLWSANGTWTAAANTFPDSGGGATWWSSQSLDHDLNKRVDAVVVLSGFSARVSIRVVPAPFTTATEIASIGPFPYGTDSTSGVCIELDNGVCTQHIYKSNEVRATAGMSPQGDRAFISIDRRSHTYSTTSFPLCPGSSTITCAHFTDRYTLAAPSQVYEVNLTTQQAVPRWTVPGAVTYLAASERNDELVTSERVFRYDTFYENDGVVWIPVGHTDVQDDCTIVFRDIRGPSVSGNAHRTLSVNPLNACDLNYSKGGGTIAPRVGVPVESTGAASSRQ